MLRITYDLALNLCPEPKGYLNNIPISVLVQVEKQEKPYTKVIINLYHLERHLYWYLIKRRSLLIWGPALAQSEGILSEAQVDN